MKRIALSVILAAASPAALCAQFQLPSMLQLPGSTRALGIGNAYPLASVDPDALFYNPALIDASRGFSAGYARYGDDSSLLGLSGGIEWWRGSIGIGLQSLSYGATAPETSDGAVIDPPPIGGPPPTVTAQVGTLAYARSFFGFRTGIAGKFVDQRAYGEHDATVAADVGIARNVGQFVFGLSGRNLGRDPDFSRFEAELPTSVTLAAGSRSRTVGPLDVMAAASGSWLRGGHYAAGGGLEAAYWPVPGRTFAARAGFRWIEDSDVSPLTLGAGFTGDRIGIDYAFEAVDDGDAIHRFTVRWR